SEDAFGSPAEAESGQRGDDDVERVCAVRTERIWMSECAHDGKKLDDRPRPSVGQQQRSSRSTGAAHPVEVNVETVNGREELRLRVEPVLRRRPVVLLDPVLPELLEIVDRRAVFPAVAPARR